MYRCKYDLVLAECGQQAARLHVEYRIKLWEPPVTAYYCTLGRMCSLLLCFVLLYHRLNGSSSHVLTATSFSYGRAKNSTPHRIKTPDLI